MKLLLALPLMLILASCTTVGFLGSGDRCTQAAIIHASFVTFSSSTNIPADVTKGERSLYAGVANACAAGDLKSINLTQLVNAYAAAVEEWKRK